MQQFNSFKKDPLIWYETLGYAKNENDLYFEVQCIAFQTALISYVYEQT